MLKQRLSLALTLILSALIIGFWGFYEPDSHPLQSQPQAEEDSIDAFITGFTSVQYNTQGLPEQKVVADKLRHYTITEHSEMDNPDIFFYRQNSSPLRLTAKAAESNADQSEIWFRHDVLIAEQAPDGMTMETQALRYEPDNGFAETDLAVTLKNPSGTTNAIGMKAYLAEQRVQLLQDVRSVYEQP